MTVAEQDQTVQTEDVKVEDTEAGEQDAVGTATTEEVSLDGAKSEEFSIEGIGSDVAPESDDSLVKEDGISEHAQEQINKKIGGAIKERNIARSELQQANAKITELESVQVVPKERPMVPLREDYELGEDYQKDMNKYQADTIAFNTAEANAKDQESRNAKRVEANDSRLIVQIDELQKKFPKIIVKDIITEAVGNGQGYGNAAAYINDSEHNGKIALYLAKNESERIRIGSLTDAGAINREIGKLEEQFTRAQKKTTKAPEVLNTIERDTETAKVDLYKIKDANEWFKQRNKEARRPKT